MKHIAIVCSVVLGATLMTGCVGVASKSGLTGTPATSNTNPTTPTLALSSNSTSSACGTDSNGTPTNNSQCGWQGTNPYSGESGTDLTSWCGGSLPGNCQTITTCLQPLTAGTNSSHTKYYLPQDLDCGSGTQAIEMVSYADINLNGHTLTGYAFWNRGALRGFHLFNGAISCNVYYGQSATDGRGSAYGCVDAENIDGSYTQGGGDKILLHHLKPQNSDGTGYVIRVTGGLTPASGSWTEFPISAFNNTCVSVIAPTTGRAHECFYTETGPAEAYNNYVHCISTTNACQLLEAYGQRTGGSYYHSNYGLGDPLDQSTLGETSRPILLDGCLNCRAAYNDLYPNSNRAIRLRDALNAEIDHNYIHTSSYFSVHSGDNDVNSGLGVDLNQKIHDNTFELAGGSALYALEQQGINVYNNTYLCAAAGCANSFLVNLQNGARPFGGTTMIDASAKTISQPTANFLAPPAIAVGSVISLSGFANSGNNSVFNVTAVSPTQIKVADPNNQLTSETSSSAFYGGVAQANLDTPTVGAGLVPAVLLIQGIPTVTVNYCGQLPISQTGTGTLLQVTGPCPVP